MEPRSYRDRPRARLAAPRRPALGLTASLDLYDYGLIGNLRTAALVSRFGSIDWACFPEFHSPSVFGRILDLRRGGFARVAPVGWQEVTQHYLPGTNVLASYFRLPGGRQLELTDAMPVTPSFIAPPQSRILRRIEATGGPVEVEVVIEPRFDYGRAPRVRWRRGSGAAIVARHGEDLLWVTAPWPWTMPGRTAWCRGWLRPGAPAFVSIEWGAPTSTVEPSVLLSATVRFWREWVRHPEAPMLRAAHVWRDWVERSELLLKLLSSRDSGAFVAAPTTSLPEWPGGPRNWDYRFAWVRDAAFAAQALLLLGHVQEARNYVRWIVARLTPGSAPRLATMYRITGEPVDAEETLPHWTGYEKARPVRIGNAAGGQVQLDIFGEVLDAVEQLLPIDTGFVEEHWPALAGLVEAAAVGWTRPDAGLWESRAAPAHYVHSKVMCWVALDRGRRIAARLGDRSRATRWAATSARIHRTVLDRGYDRDRATFVQAFDGAELDASALRIPMTGFLPFTDRRVRSTVRAVERELAQGPFVHRYHGSDGVLGPEGAFLLCSFWLVECLARAGEHDRAVRMFRSLLRIAGPLRLFSEEFDPLAWRPLGNYPQAFTHIGVLRAALAIGVEARSSGQGAIAGR
jgi:GH15 family glucan-1,4-alpha-glucosidase